MFDLDKAITNKSIKDWKKQMNTIETLYNGNVFVTKLNT